MAAIQCPYCEKVHVAKVCKLCDVTYCQKYAETHHKGNADYCSMKCTLVIWDKWRKSRGEYD